MLITLAFMFGLFLLIPLFLDYASLHFAHRVAQAAADASAHAAVVEMARALSGRWPPEGIEPTCVSLGDWTADQEVVQDYFVNVVERTANNLGFGISKAEELARLYGAQLIIPDSRNWGFITRYVTPVEIEEVYFYPVGFYAKIVRHTPLIYSGLYQTSIFEAPGAAMAAAHLVETRHEDKPCELPPEGEPPPEVEPPRPGLIHAYYFKWAVRLIRLRE